MAFLDSTQLPLLSSHVYTIPKKTPTPAQERKVGTYSLTPEGFRFKGPAVGTEEKGHIMAPPVWPTLAANLTGATIE